MQLPCVQLRVVCMQLQSEIAVQVRQDQEQIDQVCCPSGLPSALASLSVNLITSAFCNR